MIPRPLLLGIAAASVAPLVGVPAAHGDGIDDLDLPSVSRAELDASVHDLTGDVHDLDLEASITGLEEPSSGGGSAVTLNSDVLFGFDAATLSGAAATRVGEIAEDLPRGASVTITGHTDDLGSDAYNLELSEKRAEAVEKAIAKARPDLELTATGRGSADPLEPNTKGGKDHPEGRAKNRRVEITPEG